MDSMDRCVACGSVRSETPAPIFIDGAAGVAERCALCGCPLVAPDSHTETRLLGAPQVAALVDFEGRAPVRVDSGGPLRSIPQLAALAWSRPAVRSVVKTGASAVALSLAWRLLGSGLAARRAAKAVQLSDDLPGTLAGLLGETRPVRRLLRRGRSGRIVEEVIYIRRDESNH